MKIKRSVFRGFIWFPWKSVYGEWYFGWWVLYDL